MPILKKKISQDFTLIRNQLAQSETMTYEAKGLLIELLSRPEDWIVRKKQLERSHCKRDKLQRIVNELKSLGYMEITQSRKEDGTFYEKEWIIYDSIPEPGTLSESKGVEARTSLPNNGKPGLPSTYKHKQVEQSKQSKQSKQFNHYKDIEIRFQKDVSVLFVLFSKAFKPVPKSTSWDDLTVLMKNILTLDDAVRIVRKYRNSKLPEFDDFEHFAYVTIKRLEPLFKNSALGEKPIHSLMGFYWSGCFGKDKYLLRKTEKEQSGEINLIRR